MGWTGRHTRAGIVGGLILVVASSSALLACARERSSRVEPSRSATPTLWLEAEPAADPDLDWAVEAWAGVWTEYFEGRPLCQDRFLLLPSAEGLRVRTHDCTTDLPYAVEDLRWDGEFLDFVAVSPEGREIPYRVALEGRDRISGRAGEDVVFWSRTAELVEVRETVDGL